MPVHCPITIATLSAEELAERDYAIMGQAYACQNELGRLCDECVYEAAMSTRLRAVGFKAVHTQVPVTVSHRDFKKVYYLDLVADHSLYELKTATALVGEFEAQLLNYIWLLGIKRGKLLNFRPPKVEGRIIATGLSPEERRRCQVDDARWREHSPNCQRLRECLLELLADWGAFLDLALYQEALVHFMGGEQRCRQSVTLQHQGQALGSQGFTLCAPRVALKITAFTSSLRHQESHLQRLLALTPLTAMHWITLNHSKISLVTLSN